MARMIDVEKLEELMCRQCNIEFGEEPCEPDDCFIRNVILDRPTVDAVPVVHGRWVFKEHTSDYGGIHIFHCSACDFPNGRVSNYCPHCGAKMDLEVET